MKGIFALSFDHNLPVWSGAGGRDLGRSRVGQAPITGALLSLVLIEAPEGVIDALANDSDYLFLEEVADEKI